MSDRPFVEAPFLISRSVWQIDESGPVKEAVLQDLVRPYADNRLMLQLIVMSWRVVQLWHRQQTPKYKETPSDNKLIQAIR